MAIFAIFNDYKSHFSPVRELDRVGDRRSAWPKIAQGAIVTAPCAIFQKNANFCKNLHFRFTAVVLLRKTTNILGDFSHS